MTVLPWKYILVLIQEMFPPNQSPKGEHEGLDYTASGLTFDTDFFDLLMMMNFITKLYNHEPMQENPGPSLFYIFLCL